ncbi:flagellar biosynthesis anti-sigma factor FlgM [Acetivibrio clariflavus]|uniref:Negative regulator of flagellin synthesis n=1 Tax=Acetivibrio clariflavus (strain DSM 19732 / NBRC 101661 / EBR45) TaxID=720554 RepID=G8LTM6_ACECE|nr:flagellar biosynthesis anti-sigma factor FlgM [Acetivibrio clariflavus]AEV70536.1 flagellar biosynthesis anti-sigma factor FlgM [Acetivibrio clariflavus DSM 19732]
MKIWGEIPKVSGIYSSQKSVGKVDKVDSVSSKKDVVSISNEAKDIQTVMKALKNTPDIRSELVERLREKYEAGEYQVKETDIADKILKSITEKNT